MDEAGFLLFLIWILAIGGSLVGGYFQRQKRLDAERDQEWRDEQLYKSSRLQEEQAEALKRIETVSHGVTVIMGDAFNNIGPGAVIWNRNVIRDSLVSLKEKGDDKLVSALTDIAHAINAANSQKGAELFTAFTEESKKSAPNRPLLEALWDGIVKAVPTVTGLAEAASVVVKMFT